MELTQISKYHLLDCNEILCVTRGINNTFISFKNPNIQRLEISNQCITKDSPIYIED